MFSKKGNKDKKIEYIEENIVSLTNLEKMLILNEDFLITPYYCAAGVLTVGVGHTKDIEERMYTVNECIKLLKIDIAQANIDYMKVFKDSKIPNQKKDVLIDMLFNLGINRFMSFKKMIQAIKDNDWDKAGDEAENSRWYNQVGERAERNVKILRK